MSDWTMPPRNSIEEELHAEGYRVLYQANCIYRANSPSGDMIYYDRSQDDAWTKCYQDKQAKRAIVSITDCRDETGITVGLIDALLTVARVLAQRDLGQHEIQEALKDLRQDEDLKAILNET